ncbi:molybdenum cofactor guanylyltransferase MobA [Flavimaricola marinus]|nr:molybdenum cofactor guanylyltransferase MobA [Flavimaricola marinus]
MSSSLASTEPVPAIILAGGQALRMGGGDKCRLTLGGQTILGRVIHRLTAQTASLSLSANGDPGRFADYGLPVLPDPLGYDAGPLAGVLAGLDWAADMGFTSMVSVPGDTPFLPRDLVARLLDGAQETGYALAASPDPSGRLRRHPTCSVWAVNRREALRAALDNGLRKVGLWADQEQAVTVRFESSPFDPFFNINTPEDLARADTMCHAI